MLRETTCIMVNLYWGKRFFMRRVLRSDLQSVRSTNQRCQVVSTGWRSGVILESKDIFVPGPDRRELHCIILDTKAIDITNGQEGFNKAAVAVKVVWVYDIKTAKPSFHSPQRGAVTISRFPHTRAEQHFDYFFRVSQFAFVIRFSSSPIFSLEFSPLGGLCNDPHIRSNIKVIIGSIMLTIVGAILLVLGTIVMFRPDEGPQEWVFIFAGFLCFVPGFYHVYYIVCTLCGRPGYSFDRLPTFNR